MDSVPVVVPQATKPTKLKDLHGEAKDTSLLHHLDLFYRLTDEMLQLERERRSRGIDPNSDTW